MIQCVSHRALVPKNLTSSWPISRAPLRIEFQSSNHHIMDKIFQISANETSYSNKPPTATQDSFSLGFDEAMQKFDQV